MDYVFDTNLFLRLARRNDPQRQLALEALQKLRSRNEVLVRRRRVAGSVSQLLKQNEKRA